MKRILVAGIGNIFLGDDAFGVEVVRRLVQRPLPEGVSVVDFGIRGMDLAYAILDGYDWVILVDAAPRGDDPGTLYLIEPRAGDEPPEFGGHSIDPANVLRLVRAMGGEPGNVLVIGCEPSPCDLDEMDMSISAPVQAAIPEAVSMVESLIEKLRGTIPGTEQGSAQEDAASIHI